MTDTENKTETPVTPEAAKKEEQKPEGSCGAGAPACSTEKKENAA